MEAFLIQNMAPIMFAALVIFLLLGYPVAFSLAAVCLIFGFIGIEVGLFRPDFLQALPERIYGIMNNDVLLAITFFTFMGLILERSGMAEDLLDTIGQLFGTIRGVVRAPDGTIWKIATSAKRDTGPATRKIDQFVLLIGAEDVGASKKFYTSHGLAVGKSFGSKYVEFATPESPVKLGLYGRRALAKDAGVPPEGSGSHRISIGADAGAFTDPDGFEWEATSD